MVSEDTRLHQHAYMTLRNLLKQASRANGNTLPFDVSPIPTGGYADIEQSSAVMAGIIRENAQYAADSAVNEEEEIPDQLIDYGDNFFYNVADDGLLLPADD